MEGLHLLVYISNSPLLASSATVSMGFVGYKLALGQVFLQFPTVSVVPYFLNLTSLSINFYFRKDAIVWPKMMRYDIMAKSYAIR